MKVEKLWFDKENIFILTDEGKVLWQSLLWYPRLLNANPLQRLNYEIDSSGIRWDEVDEDMSLASFSYDDPEPVGIARIFRDHPELNVSAIARRMGIKQSLLAAYISGNKKPSKKREKEILDTVKQVGQELIDATAS